jgi:cytochrome c-type biogenesis protein CcmF
VHFTIRDGHGGSFTLTPSKRNFTSSQMVTTEAGIRTIGFSQLYISLGDLAEDGTVTVRIYWKPLVTLTWLGALVMALGGLLSLSDRRLRVGAPRPARKAAAAPAE